MKIKHLLILLKEAYLKANPSQEGLPAMFNRNSNRMKNFRDISGSAIKAIQAPALVVNGDAGVVRAEHAFDLAHLLPHAKLAILPGGHGEYIGENMFSGLQSKVPALVVAMIEEFLKS